ncbi:MAG: hypothetical protein ABWZ40_09850 [Caulobacterales bacterium]
MVLRLDDPLHLPCGLSIPNRIAKTAMCEGLADFSNRASGGHAELYRRWAQSGAGLLVTGAVQVDRRYLDRPSDIVVEGPQSTAASRALAILATAAKSSGAAAFMQLSHAGLFSAPAWCSEPVGPSAGQAQEGKPGRALTSGEIEDIVRRFVFAAGVGLECGFDGIQLLAGQGRLLGSLLSSVQNQRTDAWGGDLSGRAKALLDIVRAVRAAYGSQHALSVKLSFGRVHKGGLDPDETLLICDWLTREGVDLIELSVGAYGVAKKPSPEAPDVSAQEHQAIAVCGRTIRLATRRAIMISGGLQSRRALDEWLGAGVLDMAGFARPFCVDPDFAHEFLENQTYEFAGVASKMAPNSSALDGMLNKLERAAGLYSQAIEPWCALAISDLADGFERPQRRSAQAALREYIRRERDFVKGLAA